MNNTFIYALCEPNSRTVRYIGKANNPAYRFKQHLRQSSRAKTHLGNWLRSILSVGEIPALVVLREVPDEQHELAEERYIRLARGLGMELVNGTDGGDGVTMTPETRAKIGAKHRGRPKSSVARSRMSASRMGKLSTPESREANRKSHLGEKNSMFGQTHTPEACALISAAKKGKRPSDAALIAAAAVNRGKPRSPERRAAQSILMKRLWAERRAAKAAQI